MFRSRIEVVEHGDGYRLLVSDAAVFTNYLGLKKRLDALPDGKNIVIDMANTRLVDHTVMENLSHFQHEYREHGGHFEIVGLDHLRPISSHPLSSRVAAGQTPNALMVSSTD